MALSADDNLEWLELVRGKVGVLFANSEESFLFGP